MLLRLYITLARLQERILGLESLPRFRETQLTEADFVEHFGAAGPHYWANFFGKCLSADGARGLDERMLREWPAIRSELMAISRPAAELRDVLEKVGAPTHFSELGWSELDFENAMGHARWIRDRYTSFDFAAELGVPLG